jgi:hypothetical protein
MTSERLHETQLMTAATPTKRWSQAKEKKGYMRAMIGTKVMQWHLEKACVRDSELMNGGLKDRHSR